MGTIDIRVASNSVVLTEPIFFNSNTEALKAWNEFNKSKLYTESFKKFVGGEILNKTRE